MSAELTTTDFGFRFGPADVTAITSVDWGRGDCVVIGIQTPFRSLEVYVSPTGRSVRTFLDHKEGRYKP